MKIWMLGSGSRGNALLLECGDSRVLIDAGFPISSLAARLVSVGVAPQSVEAVVVTHEHGDHVKGAAAGASRWGWALYATAGTADACPELHDADVRTFEAGGTLSLRRIDVQTVPTSHDAAEPVALVATEHAGGARAGVAYDMGVVTPAVRAAFADVDLLVLEANHDTGMLHAGPYPPSVRGRISGRLGHLSNRAAAQLACDCAHAGLQSLVLAHLSEKCNDAALATATVEAALARTRFRGQVRAASQHGVLGPLTPRARRKVVAATQMSLEL